MIKISEKCHTYFNENSNLQIFISLKKYDDEFWEKYQ